MVGVPLEQVAARLAGLSLDDVRRAIREVGLNVRLQSSGAGSDWVIDEHEVAKLERYLGREPSKAARRPASKPTVLQPAPRPKSERTASQRGVRAPQGAVCRACGVGIDVMDGRCRCS